MKWIIFWISSFLLAGIISVIFVFRTTWAFPTKINVVFGVATLVILVATLIILVYTVQIYRVNKKQLKLLTQKPHLSLKCRSHERINEPVYITKGFNNILLFIHNSGDGTAKHWTVEITWGPQLGSIRLLNAERVDIHGAENWASTPRGMLFRANAEDVILPKNDFKFAEFSIDGNSFSEAYKEFIVKCWINAEGIDEVASETKIPVKIEENA